MAKLADDELTGVAAPDHPAVRAWLRARPGAAAPAGVTLLKEKGKSAIYRLDGLGPGDPAVVAKRCLRETARVEHTIYSEVLARLRLPGLRYYGWTEDSEGHGWLFLEECVADKYLAALDEHRRIAGRWLGLLHTSAARLAGEVSLPDRGAGHYRQVLGRVRDGVARHLGHPALGPGGGAVLESLAARCDVLVARWADVEQLCADMPRTLAHGDFIKRNLRVRPGPGGPSLLVFDWEVAGWGVPATDLAGSPFSGSPDLRAYTEVVRERWSGVDLPSVQRWARVGTLLRLLAAADWALAGLAAHSIEKSVSKLEIYRAALADALRALG